MTSEVKIRLAETEEAAALTALATRSKAHWGYDGAFMAAAAKELEVEPALISKGQVLVAEGNAGEPLAVAAVTQGEGPETCDLLLFFVDPDAMGRGIGRRLFKACLVLARKLGGQRMTIEADPDAAPFYEKMGARRIGEAPSGSIPGRMLPLLEIECG